MGPRETLNPTAAFKDHPWVLLACSFLIVAMHAPMTGREELLHLTWPMGYFAGDLLVLTVMTQALTQREKHRREAWPWLMAWALVASPDLIYGWLRGGREIGTMELSTATGLQALFFWEQLPSTLEHGWVFSCCFISLLILPWIKHPFPRSGLLVVALLIITLAKAGFTFSLDRPSPHLTRYSLFFKIDLFIWAMLWSRVTHWPRWVGLPALIVGVLLAAQPMEAPWFQWQTLSIGPVCFGALLLLRGGRWPAWALQLCLFALLAHLQCRYITLIRWPTENLHLHMAYGLHVILLTSVYFSLFQALRFLVSKVQLASRPTPTSQGD